jgi:hypothetical protein
MVPPPCPTDASSRKSRDFVAVISQYSEKTNTFYQSCKTVSESFSFSPLEEESRNIDLTEFFSQPLEIYPVRYNAPPLCNPGMAGYHSK